MRFISDVQISSVDPYPESVAAQIAQHIKGPIYDCGDLVEHGAFLEQEEYATYRALFPEAKPVPGNHDYYDGLSQFSWPTIVDETNQGVHVVGFDSNYWNDPAQLAALQARLTDDVFTILFLHHPLFSDNLRNGALAARIRSTLLPVVEAANVDLVIAGHGHAYEHHIYEGRHFLVIGGGGAHLDEVGISTTQVYSISAHHWLEVTPVSAKCVDVQVLGLGQKYERFYVGKPPVVNTPYVPTIDK